MKRLLKKINDCTVCANYLAHRPRPVIQASVWSKIIIIGQAPGQKVHKSGIPWDDASGNELRRWLGVTPGQFYNDKLFGLVPMGFCYPGKGSSGDLPPRPECAPLWHPTLFKKMQPDLILLIGQYAQKYYLPDNFNSSITENIKNFKKFLPHYFPLVHPSPRNRIWQKKNPWFEKKVVPVLREKVSEILG